MKRTIFTLFLLASMALYSEIIKIRVQGPIDTITEEYVSDTFKKIKTLTNPQLVIMEIDTPGGFDTSMRTIIKNILESPIPVSVFVSPKGARAASAGFFILISSDIAAMAPGTNTGAAHPVSVFPGSSQKDRTEEEKKSEGNEESKRRDSLGQDTMAAKVTNDAISYIRSLAKSRFRNVELAEKAVSESKSYTAEDCLQNNLIEYIAENSQSLIEMLENKEIRRLGDKTVTLKLQGQSIISFPMSKRQKFLRTITNPNLAYFLLIFGLIGLYIEFTHPGAIVPGVIGGISLLLAFLAFQILPINYVGLLLIILSIGFFVAEIKIQGFGMFGIGGIISFLLGSIMLIDSPIPEMRPTMSMIITFTICFAVIFIFLTYKVIQAMKRRTETGSEGIIGETGTTRTIVNDESGTVFVHGEWWKAVSDQEIPANSRIEVIAKQGFVLKVKKI